MTKWAAPWSTSSVYTLFSGILRVTMAQRITNKWELKAGLNLWVAGLFINCMSSMGHKHKLSSYFIVRLQREMEMKVLTDSIKYLLLWYLSKSSCRIPGRKEDFLHYIPCKLCGVSIALTQQESYHQWKCFLALVYLTDWCQQHT